MSIAARIESINNNLKNAYESLDELGINLTNTDKNLENLSSKIDILYNELPKVTGEGTEITLTPTRKGRMQLDLKGNTEQEQLSGKNLLNTYAQKYTRAEGIDISVDNEGIITLNGTCTKDNTAVPLLQDIVGDGREYTLKAEIVDGTYSKPSSDLRFNFHVLSSGYNYEGLSQQFGEANSVTKKLIAEHEYDVIGFRVDLGIVLNNLRVKVQLEEGSTATDYEPYCGGQPSPNPDYPQQIHVVTGDNVIKYVGKNLFDSSFNMKTPYGVTITYEDGIITINGTSNSQGFVEIRKDLLNMLGIGNHTLIFQYLSGTQEGGSIRFSFGNNNMSALIDDDNRHFSIISPNNNNLNIVQVKDFDKARKIMRWGIWINNNITFNNYKFRLYIVKGAYTSETIPAYEPYKEETFNLNLGTMELCKIGDYKDILFKNVVNDENYNAELEDGAWYKKSEIGKKVFDGTENWSNSGSNTNNFYYMMKTVVGNTKSAIDDSEIVPIFSDFFKSDFSYNSLGSAKAGTDGICIAQNHTITICHHNYTKVKTSDFKIWLRENTPCVYYPLETPTYEKITNLILISQLDAVKKAKSNESQTNIAQTNENLPFIINATALLKND